MPSQFLKRTIAALAIALAIASPSKAEEMSREQVLQSLFQPGMVTEQRFNRAFLAQVPASAVAKLIDDMQRDHGKLVEIDPEGDDFILRFAHARTPARIGLDAQGRIVTLWFGPTQPEADIATHVAAIKALPGHTSVLVLTDGKPVAAYEEDTPLAVGSAFKLAVLLATRRAVDDGKLSWNQVVRLDPKWKSLPSGQMQDWPDGTPVTIATLAHMMISISDNTATDALISVLGRPAIEAVTPRNTPLLTTRETFILQARSAAERSRWLSADSSERRAILGDVDAQPLPVVSEIGTQPSPDIEWLLSAREICALLDQTSDLPSLNINPGPATRSAWRKVSYKGGSDAGVLNLSSRLLGKDGRVHCVVATWNSDDLIEDEKLLIPYRGILDRLQAG